MAKERLSKVQRLILIEVYKDPKSDWRNPQNFPTNYRQILRKVARRAGRTHKVITLHSGEKEYIDDNFRVVFSQSLRNMERKGLIESMYYKELWDEAGRKPCHYEPVRKQHKIVGIYITPTGTSKVEEILKREPALLI